jgi:hypothetical protein
MNICLTATMSSDVTSPTGIEYNKAFFLAALRFLPLESNGTVGIVSLESYIGHPEERLLSTLYTVQLPVCNWNMTTCSRIEGT